MYENETLEKNLEKRYAEIKNEVEKQMKTKSEADDYMIKVEHEKAEKETQRKQKAFQDAEKTYNTKRVKLEALEERAFKNELSEKELAQMDTLRNEFEAID